MKKYMCLHGHFYQPPRENPCLESIDTQESAYPYHDWNERINRECYAPNAFARIFDTDGKITRVVNNYEKISFNFGPTLLSWMQQYSPYVYEAILEADKLSVQRYSGHGNAIAQAYNHMIMPLANRRDKVTQVVWGLSDFRKRFGRKPEGMWLPETAVDLETLEVLSEQGIQFTILSPGQAMRVRAIGQNTWHNVSVGSIDTTMPYLVKLPTGREITLFFYNGGISHNIAFGEMLKSGEELASCLLGASANCKGSSGIINIATDGETFGHHHKFGDMALAYCLNYIESNNLGEITNYGYYLEKYPPTHEVEIFDNSSWSCAHGIERWREDCGCNSGMNREWSQKWRRPLRVAMDWLRDELIHFYADEASKYFQDPWVVRNEYIDIILDRSSENREAFLRRHARKKLSKEEKVRVLKLLEIQRNAMLMYTSCGWFFDDISGVETVQIMQYASKAIQYVEELRGGSLESEYVKHLKMAPGNIQENGANAYEMFVRPAKGDLLKIGAHYCISSLFEEYPEEAGIYCYTVKKESYENIVLGGRRFDVGIARIISHITEDEKTVCFTVLHLGDEKVTAGIKGFTGDDGFFRMQNKIKKCFQKGDLPEVARLMDKCFRGHIYSLYNLFKDKQEKILNQIIQLKCDRVEAAYRQIYENTSLLEHFHSLRQPLPSPLFAAAEHIINANLKKIFVDDTVDCERVTRLIGELERWSVPLESTGIGFAASSWINSQMDGSKECPEDREKFEKIDSVLGLIKPLSLSLDLWNAQNIYFLIKEKYINTMQVKSESGDVFAKRWLEAFRKLGSNLNVKV
ncbi:MAG: DUF3536 domain-containing protein [Candidatus Scalindua sp.]|nr:DUF3536 domain-containing protein [Candidatus Scalindua sp.]